MIRYRIELLPDDNDTFLLTSPDLLTYGDTREAAKIQAIDARSSELTGTLRTEVDVEFAICVRIERAGSNNHA